MLKGSLSHDRKVGYHLTGKHVVCLHELLKEPLIVSQLDDACYLYGLFEQHFFRSIVIGHISTLKYLLKVDRILSQSDDLVADHFNLILEELRFLLLRYCVLLSNQSVVPLEGVHPVFDHSVFVGLEVEVIHFHAVMLDYYSVPDHVLVDSYRVFRRLLVTNV